MLPETFAYDDALAASNIACYCAGTRVLTDAGEVAVEDLVIGDRLITRSGVARPLKWIGRRSYGRRLVVRDRRLLPICFKAGSPADNVPVRDLRVSPQHAMYLEGLLIPAGLLINGVSITREDGSAEVHYIHLELDDHDVIIAEGALAESFVDDGSRMSFHNAGEFDELYPEVLAGPARYCARRVDCGYLLKAVRWHLGRASPLLVIESNYAIGGLGGSSPGTSLS